MSKKAAARIGTASAGKSRPKRAAPGSDSNYVLEEQVGHLLRRAHQRHCGIFAELIESRLTPMQFAVLGMIGQRDKVSQNHLGRLVAMDPATTQGVVRRLSERGLIASTRDDADLRRHVWRLTASGSRLLRRLVPVAETISAETLAPLTASERRTFMKLLAKIA